MNRLRAIAGQCFRASSPIFRWYVRHFPSVLTHRGVVRRTDIALSHRDHRFVTRTIYGFRCAGTTQDLIQRYIYLFGVWEANLSSWIRSALKPGDVFVDVGANIGFFSLLASQIVGSEGRVVSIEPSPTIFAQLTANVALNRVGNIRLVNCAASDQS